MLDFWQLHLISCEPHALVVQQHIDLPAFGTLLGRLGVGAGGGTDLRHPSPVLPCERPAVSEGTLALRTEGAAVANSWPVPYGWQ